MAKRLKDGTLAAVSVAGLNQRIDCALISETEAQASGEVYGKNVMFH